MKELRLFNRSVHNSKKFKDKLSRYQLLPLDKLHNMQQKQNKKIEIYLSRSISFSHAQQLRKPTRSSAAW